MGNTSSPKTSQQQYTYFDTYEDPHFGPCSIHRHIYNHNQFILIVSQSLPHSDINLIHRNFNSLINQNLIAQNQSPFLKIVDFSVLNDQNTEGNHVINSCKMPQVTFYIQFLRHNFKHFLAWRKAERRPLSIDEVFMTLNKAIKAYEMTKNNQIFGPSFKLEEISITIEGELKFHPLLGKSFFRQLSSSLRNYQQESDQSSPLMKRIIEKRKFREDKQSMNPKFITSQEYRYLSPYLSKDSEFLAQLKKFVQQILLNSCPSELSEIKNPQETQLQERKDMKRFLSDFQRIKSLNEAKKYLGESKMRRFEVDFAKLKHEESEARFSKILSEIEERSQKTDYSYHESLSYITPYKTASSKSIQFITPQQYDYS